jgi:hypothetical protein
VKRFVIPALAVATALSTVVVAPAHAALYSFTSHTFTSCGFTGPTGPSLVSCRSQYPTTWDENNSYYSITGGIQYWTVPATGRYFIDAYGAGGGGTYGGKGARIADSFNLTEGEVIRILVGQAQSGVSNKANAGGGGSFVVRTPFNTNGSILVIAGGGGGSESGSSQQLSAHASTFTSGRDGSSTVSAGGSGGGGANGNGGGAATTDNSGGGGGGFLTSGATNTQMDNRGGIAFVNGGGGGPLGTTGNIAGGFGGGGASRDQAGAGGGGGGGGGYSGGGGGDNLVNSSAGGGGSYFANGLNINRVTAEQSNPAATGGTVTITFLGSPTLSVAAAGSVTQTNKGQALVLTATAGLPGSVTFFVDGKRIPGCISIATSAGSATCNWKAAVQKNVSLSARLTSNGTLTATAADLKISVNKKSTRR